MAEEAAETAKAMAEEAAKAKVVADEMRRLMEEEDEWAQCQEELFAAGRFRRHWNILYAFPPVRTFSESSKFRMPPRP
jgi:very-short-patch-repair endonuclease